MDATAHRNFAGCDERPWPGEAWLIESGSPGYFLQQLHVGKSDFEKEIGQTVTVEVYRARDGNLWGSLLKITFPDGKSLTTDPNT